MSRPAIALVNEPVTLINAFTVPPQESERFLNRWKDNARIIADQPGFIRARMYHSLAEDAELRFINVAEWDSWKALNEATAHPEFRASTRRMLDDPDLHVTPRPTVYTVALDVHPATRCDPGNPTRDRQPSYVMSAKRSLASTKLLIRGAGGVPSGRRRGSVVMATISLF